MMVIVVWLIYNPNNNVKYKNTDKDDPITKCLS